MYERGETNRTVNFGYRIQKREHQCRDNAPASIREDYSLPIFSRKEKAEYESWEALMFEVDEAREPVKGKMLYVYLTVCLEKRGEW